MNMSLKRVVAALENVHQPEPLVAKNVFEVVLWENVAYLVNDQKRKRAFEALAERVGLTPEAIGGAKKGVIERAIGDECAEKVRRAAEVALEIEDLHEAVASNTPKARRMLKRFPGIGEPGADRILMLLGGARRRRAARCVRSPKRVRSTKRRLGGPRRIESNSRMRWMALVVVLGCLSGCGDDETGAAGSGAPCGEVSCTGSEYCCDAACGLCVEEGVACTETCGP